MEAGLEAAPAASLRLPARLASQASAVLSDLAGHVHPAWTVSAAGTWVDPTDDGSLLNLILQARFDLCWPDLSAARHPLELAWLLPPGDVRRVCAARSLFACRDALARTVDAGLRRQARALVGSHTLEALLAEQVRRPGEPVPDPWSPDIITTLGWNLLKRALPWHDRRSRRLMDLMFPPAAARLPRPVRPERDLAAEHTAFCAVLSQLFPEHAWLFGSSLATSKSA
jgi:hypothetical protein